ncbi:hypothetical protein ABT294_24770 [Nonomuraea sp. NPDC000554]|uniref:hypothetical protein n=1 Tax=Nonomuraea sp. NPDC000554 TaxID=3154259 RepID=UPI0033312786
MTHDNELVPAMPGGVRAVQVLMWIGVVLGAISLVVGVLGLVAVAALSSDDAMATLGGQMPPMGVMWGLMVISAVLLVAELVLVIRIPRRQAGTRNAIIWLFAVSAVLTVVSGVLTASYLGTAVSVVLSVIVIALLLSGSAKQYFSN